MLFYKEVVTGNIKRKEYYQILVKDLCQRIETYVCACNSM